MVMVPPPQMSAMAWRKVPGPLSALLVTVMAVVPQPLVLTRSE